MEESGSPYDVGSLSETVQSILFTPQDHGIPMQTRGIYNQEIYVYIQNFKTKYLKLNSPQCKILYTISNNIEVYE